MLIDNGETYDFPRTPLGPLCQIITNSKPKKFKFNEEAIADPEKMSNERQPTITNPSQAGSVVRYDEEFETSNQSEHSLEAISRSGSADDPEDDKKTMRPKRISREADDVGGSIRKRPDVETDATANFSPRSKQNKKSKKQKETQKQTKENSLEKEPSEQEFGFFPNLSETYRSQSSKVDSKELIAQSINRSANYRESLQTPVYDEYGMKGKVVKSKKMRVLSSDKSSDTSSQITSSDSSVSKYTKKTKEADYNGDACNQLATKSLSVLTDQEARELLLKYCQKNDLNERPANDMQIKNMFSSIAQHYTLETFAESRSLVRAFVPCGGAKFDPRKAEKTMEEFVKPWEVNVQPSHLFVKKRKKIEIPNSSEVKICYRCKNVGIINCPECAKKNQSNTSKHSCEDSITSCSLCFGRKLKLCDVCMGCGYLRWFIRLSVEWDVLKDEYISERMGLPDDLLKTCTGKIAFTEEETFVKPLDASRDPRILSISTQLIDKHRKMFEIDKILKQRQLLYKIPETQVNCEWMGRPFSFLIYGVDCQILLNSYPDATNLKRVCPRTPAKVQTPQKVNQLNKQIQISCVIT